MACSNAHGFPGAELLNMCEEPVEFVQHGLDGNGSTTTDCLIKHYFYA